MNYVHTTNREFACAIWRRLATPEPRESITHNVHCALHKGFPLRLCMARAILAYTGKHYNVAYALFLLDAFTCHVYHLYIPIYVVASGVEHSRLSHVTSVMRSSVLPYSKLHYVPQYYNNYNYILFLRVHIFALLLTSRFSGW